MTSLQHRPACRRRVVRPIAALLVAAALNACTTADSHQLAPGVYHHAVSLAEGPWVIHVVEIDLPTAWRSGTRLRSARAQQSSGGLEKTSVLAAGALAAINGDFFYSGSPVRTSGLQISSGSLVERPHKRPAFAISADGEPMVAVFGFEAGLVTAAGVRLPISTFNREPREKGLTYYNRHALGWRDSVRAEIGFQLQSLVQGSVINDTIPARVLQVRRQVWPLKLSAGQWMVAAGPGHAQAASIAAGDTVRLYCSIPPARGHLQEAIGGGPRIIRDGRVSIEYEKEGLGKEFSLDRHPRTALGYSQDGKTLFLVTVDGRQPGYSVGMSLSELADLMANKLIRFTRARRNAYQALNLDGGGSTTMVVRSKVVNRPSDQTGERSVANALLVMAADSAD